MLHPIFTVLISKPELVLEHIAGYASLMREEASTVGGAVARRAVAWAVCLMGFLVFLILAGVATMLGAVQQAFHWTLVAIPGIALGVAIAGFLVARQRLPEKAFTVLKEQLDADAQALRAVGARS